MDITEFIFMALLWVSCNLSVCAQFNCPDVCKFGCYKEYSKSEVECVFTGYCTSVEAMGNEIRYTLPNGQNVLVSCGLVTKIINRIRLMPGRITYSSTTTESSSVIYTSTEYPTTASELRSVESLMAPNTAYEIGYFAFEMHMLQIKLLLITVLLFLIAMCCLLAAKFWPKLRTPKQKLVRQRSYFWNPKRLSTASELDYTWNVGEDAFEVSEMPIELKSFQMRQGKPISPPKPPLRSSDGQIASTSRCEPVVNTRG